MKILHIIPSLNLGGAETLVTKMAVMAKNKGCDVKILVFKKVNNHLTDLLAANNIEVTAASSNKNYSPSNILFILKYLGSQVFDVVHAHLTPAQLWVALASLLLRKRIPLLTTEHSTHNRRRKLWFKPLDYFIYSRFAKIIAVSQLTQDKLVEWLPLIKNKCQVINNGVDLKEFAIKAGNKLCQQHIAVLCVGRFYEPKGQEYLLNALALTSGMELFLAGEGPLRSKLEQMTYKLNIADKVHFLGNRADIPNLIKAADIYVQPSLWEGLCIATLEAMAGGLPVIASDVSALNYVVGQTGILFPAKDSKELANKLMKLASDKELRAKLALLSITRAQDFSLSKTFQKYYNLYKNLSDTKANS